MGKPKKSKSFDSDSILAKKSIVKSKEKGLNPFEVHVNKEKFIILGRKCKHDKGLPGVSRGKADKIRKYTIGKEYQTLHKLNKFKDRRVGRGSALNDDIATARFVNEKIAQFNTKKKNIFNLNDEEVLTHRGQTLEEIEQYQDPASDDSDEELDAEFTEAAHFGGEGGGPDRKTAIEEKIAEAKRKKIEIAKEKDEIYELTNKLDEDYKSLIPLMGKLSKGDGQRHAKDDYDRLLKEMIFEPRGAVSDKLKSEEEVAKKEKEKLEKLEKDRLARMRGEEGVEVRPTHKSADDLDDGYFAASGEEEEATLAYDLNKYKDNDDKELEDSQDSEISDGQDSEISYGESYVNANVAFNNKTNKEEQAKEGRDEIEKDIGEEEEAEEEGETEEETEESESEEDNLSDLKESDNENPVNLNEPKQSTPKPNMKNANSKTVDLKAQAAKELPYVYDVPSTYDELYKLLSNKHPDYQHVIVERIIKCNHPKLDRKNRDEMVRLFGFLLQYINDIFSEVNEKNIENSFRIFDRLSSHFFDLSHMNPENASNCFLEVIKEKYDDYKKLEKSYPTMDFVIFFKLASNVFSTSDFRHFVVTPCFIFMNHILSRAHVRSRCDISIGFFIVTILLEYTQLSKRFLPAVLNFIRGVVFLSIPKRPIEMIKIIPPFSSTGQHNSLLAPAGKITDNTDNEIMLSKDLVISSIDEDFKIRALNTSFKLLEDCVGILKDNVGTCFLVEPFTELLEKLKVDQYPDFVKRSYESVKVTLQSTINKKLHYLAAPQKKPKALRLMEPRIEKVYDDKRRPKMSKEKEMRAIMVHKVKRETKGAIREIRRDTAFLSKLQINKQLQSDLERKEKVQRIFSEAAVQQGELNAISRKRKK